MLSIPINKNDGRPSRGHLPCFYPDSCHAAEHNGWCACLCPFLGLMDCHSAARVPGRTAQIRARCRGSVLPVTPATSQHQGSGALLALTLAHTTLSLLHSVPATLASDCPQAWHSPSCPLSWALFSPGTPSFCLSSLRSLLRSRSELPVLDLNLSSPGSILFADVLLSANGLSLTPRP